MTVAIGLVCKDGVLVASDSMGSTEQLVATKMIKVNAFQRAPVIWTASGSVYVIEEVQRVFAESDDARDTTTGGPLKIFTDPNPVAIRSRLHGSVNRKMRECYTKALSTTPIPPGAIHQGFSTSFLVLGYANGVPWFEEFAATGEVNSHVDKRFYAVGSGGPFAQVALSLMAHYISDDLTLEQGKRLAYRTIDTTIEASSLGVGPPVQIAICDENGARVLDTEEIRKVGDAVEGWKQLEAETLRMTPAEAAESAVGDLPTLEVLPVPPQQDRDASSADAQSADAP